MQYKEHIEAFEIKPLSPLRSLWLIDLYSFFSTLTLTST